MVVERDGEGEDGPDHGEGQGRGVGRHTDAWTGLESDALGKRL